MRSICGKKIPEGFRKLAGGATPGKESSFVHPPRMGRRNGATFADVPAPPPGRMDVFWTEFRGRRCACPRLMSNNPPGWRTTGGGEQ